MNQAKASDQWAYYQAKNIREHEDVLFGEMASLVPTNNAEAVAKARDKYKEEAERYKADKEKIQEEARALEGDVAALVGIEPVQIDRLDTRFA